MVKGGKREGAGRKAIPKGEKRISRSTIVANEQEWETIRNKWKQETNETISFNDWVIKKLVSI